MSKHVSIAIIGGGASGTITALHLMRKLNSPAHIYLIEKRKEAVFRGYAYSSQLDYEPLNVPAGRMSVFNHLPDDFFYWLQLKKQQGSETEITRDSFVSRRWFGDYLTDKITHAAQLTSHIQCETIVDTVQDIVIDSAHESYNLVLDGGHKLAVNYLIFATGNEAPNDVLRREEVAGLNGQYVANPWAVDPLAGIDSANDVLIIGTGLTMVDHAVSLHKRGHVGKVYCFSRNGYLPLVHAAVPQNFVFDYVEHTELAGVLSDFRKNIGFAHSKDVLWQNVMDALRGKTSRIWRTMDIESRKLFLKRLRSFWEIHRHRMPVLSAEVIGGMEAEGRLEILAGKQQEIKVDGRDVHFAFVSKKDRVTRRIIVQRIINCTGPSGDYLKTGNTLIKNLIHKGWMKQDELQLGIKTGVRGEIIRENGVVLQNAYSIGPLRKATEWESTAIREIRIQAEETASHIASRVELNHEVMVEIGL